MNFNDLNISDELKNAIEDMGFSELTPIQKQSIPPALKGRDIIGQAQTGSGKTLAFSIPILNKIFIPDRSPQAIVLCPTRELSMQVASEIEKLASKIKKFKVLAVYGGQPIGKQTRVLKKGVHVVVGTPGRVIDHIERGNLDLIGVESVVLDERFPGVKEKYIDEFGDSYFIHSKDNRRLRSILRKRCEENGIMHNQDEIFSYMHEFPEKSVQSKLL